MNLLFGWAVRHHMERRLKEMTPGKDTMPLGESRMDREARILGYWLFTIFIALPACVFMYFFWREVLGFLGVLDILRFLGSPVEV